MKVYYVLEANELCSESYVHSFLSEKNQPAVLNKIKDSMKSMITFKDILFFRFSNNFNTESFNLFIVTAGRRALGGIQEAKDPFLLDLANSIRHNHDEISKGIWDFREEIRDHLHCRRRNRSGSNQTTR